MKMRYGFQLIVLAVMAAVPLSASAAEPGDVDFSANINFFSLKYDGYPSMRPRGVDFRVAYYLTDAFSIELRAGTKTEGDSEITRYQIDDKQESSVEIVLNVDAYNGLFLRYDYLSDSVLTPYAVIGYNRLEATATGQALGTGNVILPVNLSQETDGAALGAGLRVAVNEDISLDLEYMAQHDSELLRVNAVNIGFIAHFR